MTRSVLPYLGLIACLLVDVSIPLGAAAGVLYALPVALTGLSSWRDTAIVGAAAIVLTALGFALSPPPGEIPPILFNRIVSAFAIIVAMGLLFRFRQKQIEIESRARATVAGMAEMMEAIPAPLVGYDLASNRLLWANRSARKLYDNRSDLLSVTFFDLLHPDQVKMAKGLVEARRHAISHGLEDPGYSGMRFRLFNGRWIEVRGSESTEGLVGVVSLRDCTGEERFLNRMESIVRSHPPLQPVTD